MIDSDRSDLRDQWNDWRKKRSLNIKREKIWGTHITFETRGDLLSRDSAEDERYRKNGQTKP